MIFKMYYLHPLCPYPHRQPTNYGISQRPCAQRYFMEAVKIFCALKQCKHTGIRQFLYFALGGPNFSTLIVSQPNILIPFLCLFSNQLYFSPSHPTFFDAKQRWTYKFLLSILDWLPHAFLYPNFCTVPIIWEPGTDYHRRDSDLKFSFRLSYE